jgi:hypothetical protein
MFLPTTSPPSARAISRAAVMAAPSVASGRGALAGNREPYRDFSSHAVRLGTCQPGTAIAGIYRLAAAHLGNIAARAIEALGRNGLQREGAAVVACGARDVGSGQPYGAEFRLRLVMPAIPSSARGRHALRDRLRRDILRPSPSTVYFLPARPQRAVSSYSTMRHSPAAPSRFGNFTVCLQGPPLWRFGDQLAISLEGATSAGVANDFTTLCHEAWHETRSPGRTS